MSDKKGRFSLRIWTTLILFMFIGSIAANFEGMYIGLFLDNTIYKDGAMGASLTLTDTVNLIASLSAVVTGIATFVMGTLSEKMKNRKKLRQMTFNGELYLWAYHYDDRDFDNYPYSYYLFVPKENNKLKIETCSP